MSISSMTSVLFVRRRRTTIFSALVVFLMPLSTFAIDVVSATHPDQDTWYASRNISMSWEVPDDVVAVSTLYDDAPDSVPRKVYAPPIREKSFIADSDGIHYFHVQMKTEEGWGDVIHYKLQIDTKPPTDVQASFLNIGETTSPQPIVSITARDETSGVKEALVSVDEKATTTYPLTSSNLYALPKELPGKHTATIAVRDHAGTLSHPIVLHYSILAIDPPKITEYTRFVEKGDVLEITGTTYPSSSIHIVYTNVKTNEIFATATRSSEDGTFFHAEKGGVPVGVYEMRARVTDGQGATSDYTEVRVISVERSAVIEAGRFITNWLSLILMIILALALVAGTLWYSFLQFMRFKRKVKRTMQEAEQALKMNVMALRRDTEEFYTILKKTEKKRELTKEEQSILRKFKKRLDATEKEIEKKLEQIG